MGDRVSVSFINRTPDRLGAKSEPIESIAIFDHWGGKSFPALAQQYADELMAEQKDGGMSYPIDRREPDTVILDFIRWLFANDHIKTAERVKSRFYLGKDESDGDNSDNGHFAIDISS